MSKRHEQALSIQEGAVNLFAITKTLLTAIQEVRTESGDPATDEAVRLIIHQMSSLANVGEFSGFASYEKCKMFCEERSPRYQGMKERFNKVVGYLGDMTPYQQDFTIEFHHELPVNSDGRRFAIEGIINLLFQTPRITYHAVEGNLGKEWIATGYGLIGQERQAAKEYVEGLRNAVQNILGIEYVGIMATDDPGLF